MLVAARHGHEVNVAKGAQVREIGGRQFKIADDPALGEEQMQFVAKDGLLFWEQQCPKAAPAIFHSTLAWGT